MIGKIKGNVENIKPMEILVDVNGVCYQLSIPFTVYEKFKNEKQVELLVYMYVREDQIKLYGFCNFEEKKIFELLLKISGIGPSMALSIISGMGIKELINAVKREEVNLLTKIPGIGKSKAEKLIFELKRKISQFDDMSDNDSSSSPKKSEAIEALVSLGFEEKKIRKILDDLIKANNAISVEELVRKSLQELAAY